MLVQKAFVKEKKKEIININFILTQGNYQGSQPEFLISGTSQIPGTTTVELTSPDPGS